MSIYGPSEGVNSGAGQGTLTLGAAADSPKGSPDDEVRVFDGQRQMYWGPGSCGYTPCVKCAGIYRRSYADYLKKNHPLKRIEVHEIGGYSSASSEASD